MSLLRILFLVFVCVLPTVGQARMADLQCDDTARLQSTLTNVLGANRQGGGLRDPDTMLEVWVTKHSGDWMIVQTYTNGTSCIVAMGEHWEDSLAGPA